MWNDGTPSIDEELRRRQHVESNDLSAPPTQTHTQTQIQQQQRQQQQQQQQNAALAGAGASKATTQTKDDILVVQKKVFYRTVDDSNGAHCLRMMMCGCFDPKYVFNTESVRTEKFENCTWRAHSIDIDDIADMSMRQELDCGYCLFDRGNVTLYLKSPKADKGQPKDHFPSEKFVRIQHASSVFREFSTHVHHINNLKFGMKRPDVASTAFVMYDSDHDSRMLRCWRGLNTCLCCFSPRALITKERITTFRWEGCGKVTQQFDTDKVQNVTLESGCCEMFWCASGTLTIEGSDPDQKNGVVVQYVGHVNKVFRSFDEYVKVLNNRDRILGTEEMVR